MEIFLPAGFVLALPVTGVLGLGFGAAVLVCEKAVIDNTIQAIHAKQYFISFNWA